MADVSRGTGKPLPPVEAVSVQVAARLLSVCQETLLNWASRGLIILTPVGPRLLRVPRTELTRLRAGLELSEGQAQAMRDLMARRAEQARRRLGKHK